MYVPNRFGLEDKVQRRVDPPELVKTTAPTMSQVVKALTNLSIHTTPFKLDARATATVVVGLADTQKSEPLLTITISVTESVLRRIGGRSYDEDVTTGSEVRLRLRLNYFEKVDRGEISLGLHCMCQIKQLLADHGKIAACDRVVLTKWLLSLR